MSRAMTVSLSYHSHKTRKGKAQTYTNSGGLDFLQYTITSRKEMPNALFCDEIERAAQDLYDLHADAGVQKASL